MIAEIEEETFRVSSRAAFDAASSEANPWPLTERAWQLDKEAWAASERAGKQRVERTTRFRFTILGFLMCTANASKILWPPNASKRDPQTAAELRADLGLDESSPIRLRHVRDNLEHFDERIEAHHSASNQGAATTHTTIVDGVTINAGMLNMVSIAARGVTVVVTGPKSTPEQVLLADLADEIQKVKHAAKVLAG